MVKLVISLCVLFLAYSASLDVPPLFLKAYYKELRAALNDFNMEVKTVIKEAEMMVMEYKEILKTLHNSATFLQEEVSDTVINTLTSFDKNVNSLFTDVSVDVSKCVAVSYNIESTASDILINANTCVHDKLNKAQVYIDESIASIEHIISWLDALQNIVEDTFFKTVKNKNITSFFHTLIFLKSISSAPSYMVEKIFLISIDIVLVIARIESLMISDCISTETISSFILNTLSAYSKIESCIANFNSFDIDLYNDL